MKERSGTVARLSGLAEGVAAAARRRQQERAPRIVLYDEAGHPRLLARTDGAHPAIVEAATAMVELAADDRSEEAPEHPAGAEPGPAGPAVDDEA